MLHRAADEEATSKPRQVHLAAALPVVEADLVLVAADRALLTAAESVDLMVAAIG